MNSIDDAPKQQEVIPQGRLTVKAVIKRADGTIEDLGIISEGTISLVSKGGK